MEEYKGIKYNKPIVTVLSDNGIGHSEFAGRTCYDSFDKSENGLVKSLDVVVDDMNEEERKEVSNSLSDIEDSELLKQLSFVHFHHSVLEHSVISFLVKGISRAVLQELARHRIASYSVRSTRYTLDEILYNFIVAKYIYKDIDAKNYFITKTLELDIFTIANIELNSIELGSVYDKLNHCTNILGTDETLSEIIPKSNIERFKNSPSVEEAFEILAEKKKRNAGDAFKSIVVFESMKVDLVMTINLRSLKNFFDLRLNGAAWFQIQWLAEEMKEQLPNKYMQLIFKDKTKGQ